MMRRICPALAALLLVASMLGSLQVPGAGAFTDAVPCSLANADKQVAQEAYDDSKAKREAAEKALEDAKGKIPKLQADLNSNLADGKANGAKAFVALGPTWEDSSGAPVPVPDKVKRFISAWKDLPTPVPESYWDSFRGVSPQVLDPGIAGPMLVNGPGDAGFMLPFNFLGNNNRQKDLQAGKDAVAKAEAALSAAESLEEVAKEWRDAAQAHYDACQGADPPPSRKRNFRESNACDSELWFCP